MERKQEKGVSQPERGRWERPTIRKTGSIADVLKGGGGKLSTAGGDPGDGRKPTGGE